MVPLPITGAFHAKHLTLPELDSIIGQSNLLDLHVSPKVYMIFGSGRQSNGTEITIKSLISEAMDEIFAIPQDSSAIEDSLASFIIGNGCRVSRIGPAKFNVELERILPSVPIRNRANSASHQEPKQFPSLDGRDAIAVIGMAGRFPGSDDLEEFWRNLSEGRDLSQKVFTSAANSYHRLTQYYHTRYQRVVSISKLITIPLERFQTPR